MNWWAKKKEKKKETAFRENWGREKEGNWKEGGIFEQFLVKEDR